MNNLQRGNDNLLENYFLELIIKKHVIDREIQEILHVIDTSDLHSDYALLLKKALLGEKNMYLENWGTLGANLTDIMKTTDVRGHEVEKYGIVLGTILRIVEEIFDVGDEYFHDFLLLEEKEDVEHQVILLIKEVLDFMEEGLKEVLSNITNLDSPIENNHIRKEFAIIRGTLLQYGGKILESKKGTVGKIKGTIDILLHKLFQTRSGKRPFAS